MPASSTPVLAAVQLRAPTFAPLPGGEADGSVRFNVAQPLVPAGTALAAAAASRFSTMHPEHKSALSFDDGSSSFLLRRSPGSADEAVGHLRTALLQEATSQWLELGGDDRLVLSGLGCNKYYSTTRPTPDVIHRGSCTSSSPSTDGFAAAAGLLDALWTGSTTLAEAQEEVRSRVHAALGSPDAELVFTPSGSDAEVIPLLLAIARSRAMVSAGGRAAVHNIVTCAGEVGSGTAGAAGGKQFSPIVPDGSTVENKAPMAGFTELADVTVQEIKARDGLTGDATAAYEAAVAGAAEDFLASHPHGVVVVHSVAGSKTGLAMPSATMLSDLTARHGARVVTVLDACQMRSTTALLESTLAAGGLCLVTASKFFCGPPFSGAVLVPRAACAELDAALGADMPAPPGIGAFIARDNVPASMPNLKAAMPRWDNVGLLLRWAAGLFEMEAFTAKLASDSAAVTSTIQDWVQRERDAVSSVPALRLVPDDAPGDASERVGGINMVVSFQVLVDGAPLGTDDMKLVHKFVWMDCSDKLPADAPAQDVADAKVRALIGQAVALPHVTILRTTIGAANLRTELMGPEGMEGAMARDRLVLAKLAVVAKHFKTLCAA